MVMNEHRNIYGLMPSPNMIARHFAKIHREGSVVLGNLPALPAERCASARGYAMLDG
jgi:hypothetical protein